MEIFKSLGDKTVISTRFWMVFVASVFSIAMSYVLMLTDNVVAGQFIGDDAVAAMTLMFPIITLTLFVAYLISDGLVMMVSYARGKNDREEINRLFSLGIILAVGCSLIFVSSLYFLREEILNFWDTSEHLKFFASEYYSGIIFCSLFQFVSIFNYTIFFSEGMERACVVGAVASFVVNVVLDIVLCHFIGVRGIGLATTFGNLTSVVVQIYFFADAENQLRFKWYWNLKKVWRGIVLSFYHTIDTLCISILPLVISTYVLQHFGEEKLIIVTVALNLLTMVLAIYTGLIDCLQPMVCQYHAEKNLHSVIKTMRLGMAVTVALSLAMSLAGMIFADFLPSMFGVKDAQLADETSVAMRYFLPFMVFLGCTQSLGNYYIYVERMNYGAILKTCLLLIFPIASMFLGEQIALNVLGNFSMNAFWFSVGTSFFAAFAVNYFYLRTRNGVLRIAPENLSRQLSYDVNATA